MKRTTRKVSTRTIATGSILCSVLLLSTLLLLRSRGKAVLSDQPRSGSCSPIESHFDDRDVKLCKKLLAPVVEAKCSSDTCCKDVGSFKHARCHCWSGFNPSDLKTVEDIQAWCTHASGSAESAKPTAASNAAAKFDAAQAAAADAAAKSEAAEMRAALRAAAAAADTAAESASDEPAAAEPEVQGQVSILSSLLPNLGAASSEKPAKKVAEQDPIQVFVGVLTSGKNVDARAAIRGSWGRSSRLHRVMFFAAKPREPKIFEALRKEAAAEGDVVVLPNVWEDYHNITHQTLEILRVAALHPQASHTMKVDDDSYVRVDRLMRKLEIAPKSHMFMGAIEDAGGGPNREVGHQWYVSEEEWPDKKPFPFWAHGVGYIVTQDFVREIAAGAGMAALNHRMLRLEDVAMGAWVQFVAEEKKWQVDLRRERGFNFGGCRGGDVVAHYITPKAMLCMAKQRREQCCTKEGEPRAGGRRMTPRA